MTTDYDYIIAGGGMAGLSLGWYLSKSDLPFSRVLLLDREQKTKNDRTWCFWSLDDPGFASIVHKRWACIDFKSETFSKRIDLGDFRYRMVQGIDFYAFVLRELSFDKRFEFKYGNVEIVRDSPDGSYAEVMFEGQHLSAAYVFDGLFLPKEFRVDELRYSFLKQHFYGLNIRARRPVFDPECPTLFDLRIRQAGAFRFMYILPESAHEGLVEYTFFSDKVIDKPEYLAGLKTYIENSLGLSESEYEILEEESGIIPMTDQPFRRRTGKRVLTIGSKGGRVKASTGFAFWRTQRDSIAIVESLRTTGAPFSIPQAPNRYRAFDAMLLHILKHDPETAVRIFSVLFERNPIERIFRFLDEDGTLPENLKLMTSVPPLPFISAWMNLVLRRISHWIKSFR